MHSYRISWRVVAILVGLLASAASVVAQDELVVRTAGSIDSGLLARHHLTLLATDSKHDLHRVRVAPGNSGAAVAAALASEPAVLNAEPNARASLPAPVKLNPSTVAALNQSTVSVLDQSTVSVLDALLNRQPAPFYGATVPAGYLAQPAMKVVENDAAHRLSTGIGVLIADIDNGLDANHPALRAALVPGFNFINNSSDVSVFSGLNQSTVSVLNQSTSWGQNQSTSWGLNQSTVSVLDQSTVSVLDQSTVSVLDSLPAMFGHGTEVAGVLHLVAPQSRIMPLKAFGTDGTGQVYDVVRAIYYAVDQGADVINMSFAYGSDSKELRAAIDYADRKGVILVASVGNDGKNVSLFPAAYSEVLGIAAANTYDDSRAAFSNYGNAVFAAAPGSGVITAFPGGKYAAVWGTSFSAPQVAGEAALLLQRGLREPGVNNSIKKSSSEFPGRKSDMGYGRIDLFKAVSAN
jgi:subtilisin family serine protease